jgi:hypothetical protein
VGEPDVVRAGEPDLDRELHPERQLPDDRRQGGERLGEGLAGDLILHLDKTDPSGRTEDSV